MRHANTIILDPIQYTFLIGNTDFWKDGPVKERPNLVKNEMNSLLMMPTWFYYTGVVLQNYVHVNVRLCILGVHWSVKDGNLKHFFVEIDALCHILLLNLDILQGSFRLCNWLSLRRLVSWINHLPPACWSTFRKSNSKQQFGCRFDIMDYESYFFVFWHMQLYMSWYIISFVGFTLLNILHFFQVLLY